MGENKDFDELSSASTRYVDSLKKVLYCQKNFRCMDDQNTDICKAKEGGPAGSVYCLEENSKKCIFSMTLGFKHICKCPLRVHILRELKK